MLLSVVIVNYNVKYFLEQCLCSVTKAMKGMEGEIIVVDNNSTDNSFGFFQDKFPHVNFIWNTQNVGFAKANNQAIRIAKGEYILILNPDTIVPEDCFEKCIAFIQSKKNNGALGIQMVDGAGKFLKESKRAFPDPITAFYKLVGLSALFPRSKIFSKYHLSHLDKNKNHEVDVLAGAFMLIPKKIMEVVTGFDEDFFMYGEDIDLSFRIQQAGFHNYYFGESSIIHFKGESTKKMSINYVKMFYNAMSIFSRKHHGGAESGIYQAFIQGAIAARGILAAFSRFLKWIGLPIIDSSIILISFALAKNLWEAHLHYELHYSTNLIIVAFPVFTFLFIASSYFSGLYDNGFKQSQLNKSAITALLVILSVYALVPEHYQFSRPVLIASSLIAFILMTLIRQILIREKIIKKFENRKVDTPTFIVGTKGEYNKIAAFLKQVKNKKRILERFPIDTIEENNLSISLKYFLNQLPQYLQKEIIFCEGNLSFKTIIDVLPIVPASFEVKFFARGCHTIIGSDDKDIAGEFIANEEVFQLSNPMAKRNKRLIDVIISIFYLSTFPFHFIFKKRALQFFKNCFQVLFKQKTWVGYVTNEVWLPPLKPGVITPHGIPNGNKTTTSKSLLAVDKKYALQYNVWEDLKLITLHYSSLS